MHTLHTVPRQHPTTQFFTGRPTNSAKALKELASAGPHGKYCTWLQTDNHASMSPLNSGWMLSLMPNQQCHSTDGKLA